MKLLLFILLLNLVFITHAKAQKEDDNKLIFCMYLTRSFERRPPGQFEVEDIDEEYCTHLIYAYFGLGDDGTIKSLNEDLDFAENDGLDNIKRFNNKKDKNPDLKTLLAVGGWDRTEKSIRYSNILKNNEKQDTFIKSSLDVIEKFNFNGLALHWTYPGINGGNSRRDKSTFTSLVKKLSERLKEKNLIFTVICHGLGSDIYTSYNVPEISKYVDYIYLTSYDFYGDWSDHIGISSGLYVHPDEENTDLSVDSVVMNWINAGASPEKIIMGVTLFGRTFTLMDKTKTTPCSARHDGPGKRSNDINYPGIISYSELCKKFKKESWEKKWESTQLTPYAYYGNQWVSYEDEKSLELKSKYVREKQLAGIAAVFVEDDDFKGSCGEKYPRLKALNQYLRPTKFNAENEIIKA